jgi:serine/threonine-protein kinase
MKYGQQQVAIPALIGKNTHQAALLLANAQLNLRILNQKEDNDLPDGTIISQTPPSGQLIRINKPIFCVISKKKSHLTAPNCIGRSKQEIDAVAQKNSIHVTAHTVMSSLPSGICIGQHPAPENALINGKIDIYCAESQSQEIIFPNLVDKKIQDLIPFFEENNFKVDVVHTFETGFGHDCKYCRVIEQRPLAGSIILKKNVVKVQLLVE